MAPTLTPATLRCTASSGCVRIDGHEGSCSPGCLPCPHLDAECDCDL